MKNITIYKLIFASLAIGGVLIGSDEMKAQKFAIKPYADLGVGSAMSLKSDMPLSTKSSSNTSFGVDFGYTFWRKGGNSLEANIGLGYSVANLKLGIDNLSYRYEAPAAADMDGDTYIRYYQYELTGMQQKINLGYFNIPIYLTYGYQFGERIGLHADLGFRFGFKCASKLSSVSGMVESYGVYPEYDDLLIDDSWLNGFGESDLADAKRGDVDANGFNASLMVGAGLDVLIAGPVWLNLGVRYDCGFTNSFKHLYDGGAYTYENAPVSYTVAEGQEVKPLTGYLNSSKLSPFSIHAGLTIKF